MGENETKTVKSDLQLYYAAAAVLLIAACVCVILIFRNLFGGPVNSVTAADGGALVKTESLQEDSETAETAEELKISHAGLADPNEKKSDENNEDHQVFRSRT